MLSWTNYTVRVRSPRSQDMLGPVQVPALKLVQRGVDLYLTTLQVNQISKLYQVDRFDIEQNATGYQRSLDDSRARQVKKYIQEEAPGTLPAAVVMNCRDPKGLEFKTSRNGAGTLRIKSKLWLVDGQHRVAGLELAATKDTALGGYSVPVVILNGQDRDSEMEHFFVINDRQKGVPVDLVLRFLISNNGKFPPSDRDDALAIKVTDEIALDRSSCWFKRIQLTNEPRLRTHTITERSFHRALLPVVRISSLRRSEPRRAASVIVNYWNALRDLIPESFADPRRYLIMRTVGAYTMNLVFPHVFEICLRKENFSQPNFLEVLLKTGIDSEDWTKESAGSYAGIVGFQRLAEKYIQKLPDAKLPLR